LREAVTHLVGRTADRATYDVLLELGRKTTNTDERVRYYTAAASAPDAALAKETLAIALTDELPTSMVGQLISAVASQGEHRELAWDFVRENFTRLSDKQGPSFRRQFVSTLFSNFSDPARAEELKNFAPVNETSGSRTSAERAQETILSNADFAARQLPEVDEWVRRQAARP
jgi:aminopeptidase N